MTSGSSQGLFVIVAVVIFGIFVAISYLLFNNQLKTGLGTIFSEVVSEEHSEKVALINTSEQTPIYVEYVVNSKGTVEILRTGMTKTSLGNGSSEMIGNLVFPDFIEGKKVTKIGDKSLMNAMFSEKLVLPKHLEYLGVYSLAYSKFLGELDLPNTLEYLGSGALEYSGFTGEFKLPPKIHKVEMFTFKLSKFTGAFTDSNKLTKIGHYAFFRSEFTGDFNLTEVEHIGGHAFENSKFTGVMTTPKLKTLGTTENFHEDTDSRNGSTFLQSSFTSINIPENVQTLGKNNIRMFDGTYK